MKRGTIKKSDEAILVETESEIIDDRTEWEKDISCDEIKNDPDFQVYIGIIVEESSDYYRVMEIVNDAVMNGKRWRIKAITKEYVKDVVLFNLRTSKYQPFRKLCLEILRHTGYNFENPIPTGLMIYFIFYEIRRLKNLYSKMKMYEVEVDKDRTDRVERAVSYKLSKLMEESSITSVKATEKSGKSVASTKNKMKKNKKNLKKAAAAEEKYGTRRIDSELSTRGEERVLRYIDDYPHGGPDIYLLITTIYDHELATELIEKMGIQVHCAIRLGNELRTRCNTDIDKEKNRKLRRTVQYITDEYYNNINIYKRKCDTKESTALKEEEIDYFWKNFIVANRQKTSLHKLTMALYMPSINKIDFKNENWRDKLKELIYEEIAFSLYDLYTLSFLYNKYMSAMEVIDVEGAPFNCILEEMHVYNYILNIIPEETISIPIIFDSMIAQISNLFGEPTGYEDILPSVNNDKIIHYSSDQKKLVMNLTDLNLMHDVLTIKSKPKDLKPRAILYGDIARLNSYHLGKTAKFVTEKTFRQLSMRYKKLFHNINTKDQKSEFNELKKHLNIFRNVVGIRDRKKFSEILLILGIIGRNPFGPKYPSLKDYLTEKSESNDEQKSAWKDYINKNENLEEIEKIKKIREETNFRKSVNETNRQEEIVTPKKRTSLYSNKFNENNITQSTELQNEVKTSYLIEQSFNKSISEGSFTADSNEKNEEQGKQINKSELKKNVTIKPATEEPIPNEHEGKNGTSIDLSSKYLIEDILNGINDSNDISIQQLNSIEEISSEVMVQTLFDMYITHNSCENIYIPLLDGFLFKFYNCPKDKSSTSVLQTRVTLRDFIKYSLPEEYEWMNNMLKEIEIKNKPITFQPNLHLYEEDASDPIDPPIKINPVQTIDSSYLKMDQPDDVKNIKEEQKKISNEEESIRLSTQVFENESFQHQQAVSKIYNIQPELRLQFFTRTTEAMFRHGTKIKIEYKHKLYAEKILKLELITCGHRIYYSSNIDINEDPVNLLIQHRTGMILSFSQNETKKLAGRYKKMEEEEASDYEDIPNTLEINKNNTIFEEECGVENIDEIEESSLSAFDDAEQMERCKIKPSPHPVINRFTTYSLTVSWPSGYYMECYTLPEINMLYIKEYYKKKGPNCKLIENETYRLNLHNRNVVKFKNDKSLEILFPTGKKIVCSNYYWKRKILQKRNRETGDFYEKYIRTLIPVEYNIFHTNGQIISIKDQKEKIDGKIDVKQYTDVFNDYKVTEMANGTTIIYKNDSSQVVEFNDGTRFTSVIHESPEEIFCEWTMDEKTMWFQGYTDFNVISESSIDQNLRSSQLIKLEDDGFIYMSITTFTEHPNFATTYNCAETNTMIIYFPMNTTVYLYSNGTYDVTFSNGTNISIKKDRFIIDKFLKKSLFQHSVIMPHALKFIHDSELQPLIHFMTSDIYGNELKIDTANCTHYRYALSEENRFCLKHLSDNVNFFFLRRDLSGIEIFPNNRLATSKEITKETEGSRIQEFWNIPFKDTIMLTPTTTASEEWIMPYSTPITSKYEPSTYGNSWIFPYEKKQQSYLETPKTLTMRVIKSLMCEDIEKELTKYLNEYKKMVDINKLQPICKCSKNRPWENVSKQTNEEVAELLYKHGNITIKTPDESFMDYVKEYIVLHAARVALNEKKKFNINRRYEKQRSTLLEKRIPPYFGSCFGMAYLLTEEVRERTNRAIEEIEYEGILDALLDKHMDEVDDTDIEDIIFLLRKLQPDIWKDGVSLKTVLSIGKELKGNFKNIRSVISYHMAEKRKRLHTESKINEK